MRKWVQMTMLGLLAGSRRPALPTSTSRQPALTATPGPAPRPSARSVRQARFNARHDRARGGGPLRRAGNDLRLRHRRLRRSPTSRPHCMAPRSTPRAARPGLTLAATSRSMASTSRAAAIMASSATGPTSRSSATMCMTFLTELLQQRRRMMNKYSAVNTDMFDNIVHDIGWAGKCVGVQGLSMPTRVARSPTISSTGSAAGASTSGIIRLTSTFLTTCRLTMATVQISSAPEMDRTMVAFPPTISQ